MKSLISKRSVRRLVPVTKQNTNIQSKRASSLKLILHNISFQGLDSLQNISKEYTIFRWLFQVLQCIIPLLLYVECTEIERFAAVIRCY